MVDYLQKVMNATSKTHDADLIRKFNYGKSAAVLFLYNVMKARNGPDSPTPIHPDTEKQLMGHLQGFIQNDDFVSEILNHE